MASMLDDRAPDLGRRARPVVLGVLHQYLWNMTEYLGNRSKLMHLTDTK